MTDSQRAEGAEVDRRDHAADVPPLAARELSAALDHAEGNWSVAAVLLACKLAKCEHGLSLGFNRHRADWSRVGGTNREAL